MSNTSTDPIKVKVIDNKEKEQEETEEEKKEEDDKEEEETAANGITVIFGWKM
jgi:ribosomal protein L12E/L44/L45/RPP1/RPP2